MGQALHNFLIVGPADWLNRTPPRRLLIILLLIGGASLVFIEIAPLLLAADIAPALWFADLTLYVDAVLVAALAQAGYRFASMGTRLTSTLRRIRAILPRRSRPRRRDTVSRRAKRPPPANDDEPAFSIRLTA